jgi:hypothetical protein
MPVSLVDAVTTRPRPIKVAIKIRFASEGTGLVINISTNRDTEKVRIVFKQSQTFQTL